MFHHIVPLQVRYNDVDQQGHINNAVIMEFFDLGKSDYFETVGISVTPESDFTVLIVHYDVDFTGQMLFHDKMQVCTRLEKLGNKSLTLHQEVHANGKCCVVCHTILSGYSRSAHASAVIPEEIKERIRQYEGQ
ncbi:MAG: acyl-CoA thioesterase [Bacteroidales bacterium]|nr:acyl-CoA thioesterase [Bacteroidales bacterium]